MRATPLRVLLVASEQAVERADARTRMPVVEQEALSICSTPRRAPARRAATQTGADAVVLMPAEERLGGRDDRSICAGRGRARRNPPRTATAPDRRRRSSAARKKAREALEIAAARAVCSRSPGRGEEGRRASSRRGSAGPAPALRRARGPPRARPSALEPLVRAGSREPRQRREARRHRERVARERARLVDGASGATSSITSPRPPYAAAGRPPPTILPSTSGRA